MTVFWLLSCHLAHHSNSSFRSKLMAINESDFGGFSSFQNSYLWSNIISLSEFCFRGTILLLRFHFILSPLMTGSFFVMPPHSPFKFIIPICVNSHQWIWLRGFSSDQDSYLWSNIISLSESEFGGAISFLPFILPPLMTNFHFYQSWFLMSGFNEPNKLSTSVSWCIFEWIFHDLVAYWRISSA